MGARGKPYLKTSVQTANSHWNQTGTSSTFNISSHKDMKEYNKELAKKTLAMSILMRKNIQVECFTKSLQVPLFYVPYHPVSTNFVPVLRIVQS